MDKLAYERAIIAEGFNLVCGADEVGRGPLAGPVVCAAVIMPLDDLIEGVDDSKKLSVKKREALYEKILEKAIAYAICRVEPEVIDEINILQATRLCMKNAVESLEVKPDFLLTDGNMILDVEIPQQSIVKGDALSYSIGAASVIAKVYRDRIMDGYALQYPAYAFESNKGYGTKKHIEGIIGAGICPVHRKSFVKKWL
ncbi:MAG: ribonuclease HII [Clostridia bacterium]|nr:ribonuclease HII [Clostridia bacterium]